MERTRNSSDLQRRRLEDSLSNVANQFRRVEDVFFEKRDQAIINRLRAIQKTGASRLMGGR